MKCIFLLLCVIISNICVCACTSQDSELTRTVNYARDMANFMGNSATLDSAKAFLQSDNPAEAWKEFTQREIGEILASNKFSSKEEADSLIEKYQGDPELITAQAMMATAVLKMAPLAKEIRDAAKTKKDSTPKDE